MPHERITSHYTIKLLLCMNWCKNNYLCMKHVVLRCVAVARSVPGAGTLKLWAHVSKKRRTSMTVREVPVSQGFHIRNLSRADFEEVTDPHDKAFPIQVSPTPACTILSHSCSTIHESVNGWRGLLSG